MQVRSAQYYWEASEAVLATAAAQLHDILGELAAQLRPFPSFLNMVSVQAVELEPVFKPLTERGCLVVNPDGEICEFNLTTIPGAAGVLDMESIEEFQELDLGAEEYILYASAAIIMLTKELNRRSM